MTVVARMRGCSSMARSLSRAQRGIGRRLNHAELGMLELPGMKHQTRCCLSSVPPIAGYGMTGRAEVNPDLVRPPCVDLHLHKAVSARPNDRECVLPVDGRVDGDLVSDGGLDASEVELPDRASGKEARQLRRRPSRPREEHHSTRRRVEAMHEIYAAVLHAQHLLE